MPSPPVPVCSITLRPGDLGSVASITVEYLSQAIICWDGFVHSALAEEQDGLTITLQGPGNTTETSKAVSRWDESDGWWWWFEPVPGEHPVGDYEIRAEQRSNIGDVEAVGLLEVVPRSPPASLYPEAQSGVPGESFEIYLLGFAPEAEVSIFLYEVADVYDRHDPNDPYEGYRVTEWTFRAALPSVTVNGSGMGILRLVSQAADPPGDYRIHTDPVARCFDGPPCATITLGQR